MSTKSINILGILELGSILWMNLVSLEYFLKNKTQNMDLNALLSEKIKTIFFAITRCSLLYVMYILCVCTCTDLKGKFSRFEHQNSSYNLINEMYYVIF